MKKQLFSFLVVISFVFSVSAQKTQVAPTDRVQTNLRKHVEYLASDKLEGRRTGTVGATTAAGYIANQFAKLRLRPGSAAPNGKAGFLQAFSHGKPNQPTLTGYNVIGILDGTDKQLRSEAIVIGAHYDHLGLGGEGSLAANSTEIHHGADDNASGTAAIIELARQFAKEKKNKRTIIFIAFSGEEEGLFGSKYYIANPSFPIENTVAMINLDMVGRLNERKLTIGGIGTAAEFKGLVEGLNPKEIIETTFKTLPGEVLTRKIRAGVPFVLQLSEDGFGPSDHSSFYTKKIPVLFFFTGTHLDYHKPSDTAEKINYIGQASIVGYVGAIVDSVDKNPVRPTYAVAKSSGMSGGRTSFNVSLGTIPSYTDSGDGLTIDGVRDNSPAAKAGLTGGDKIVRMAGKEVKNIQDYMSAMGTMKAGDEYDIVVKRGTETLTLKIVPAPAAPRN